MPRQLLTPVRAAEEIKDASRVLPLGMMWTLVLNGLTGFIMIITFAFCAGDLTSISTSASGFPFIQVFYNSTGSPAGTIVMTCLLALMALCSTISNVATASRQMFAFARDHGLPFAHFLSDVRVSPFPVLDFSPTFLLSAKTVPNSDSWVCRSSPAGTSR